ncbi:uncharacterized protein LOC118273307 isoform X1 [Spodoptera frugiperda]|uniref:Uncharacterized protein LOC118273307 isoform X1 n=1 Tax=Spodoptera frugiperda TaxID=7108 RepID=A0A9R0EC85_SPOFR|nr:uncharacterized protein LOC118273307 isoform X1 [Spodoptera frugiperda]
MDTKSLQKNKQPKKMKTAKDKHEVFVLPPDLLKKLGISIGNINVNQVNSSTPAIELPSNENINNGYLENIPNQNCSQMPSDNSILETATLMKKSVFLSPTFVPTIANGIPEEIKITNKSFVPETVTETNLPGPEPVSSIEVLNVSDDITEECLRGDSANLQFDISFNGVPTSLNGHEMEIEENMNVILEDHIAQVANGDINSFIDDQSFEINSDIELTVNSTDTDPNPMSNGEKPIQNTSKINIISEETIPLSKLRELKSLKLCNVKNLTPITVQSIIETKTNHEISKSEEQMNVPIITVPLEIKNIKPSLDLEENVENIQTEATIFKITENTPVVIEETIKHTNNKSVTKESCNIKKIHSDKNNSSVVKDESNVSDINKSDNLSDSQSNLNTVTKTVTKEIDKNENIFQNCNGKTDENEDSNLDCTVKPDIVENHKELDTVGTHSTEQTIIEQKHGMEPKVMSKSKSAVKKDSKQSDTEPEDEKSEHLELASILNATKTLANNNAEIKVDKVKEIAAYLKKFSHIYTDKNKSKKALQNVPNTKKTINLKTNTTESKLSIQGVEKPGGSKKDKEHTGECKVVKTYARQILPKRSNKSTPKLHCHAKQDVMVDQELDAVNVATSNKIQEFCLCYDFGRLAYYDSDNSYEHIHFKNNNSANCELATIFSIYSDEPVVNRDRDEVDEEDKTEENVDISVCWNLFENEFCENINDSEAGPLLVDDCVVDDASPSDIQVSPVNNTVPDTNDGTVSEIQPEVQIVNNSDIILDTNDHDMVEAETKKCNSVIDVGKPLSANVQDSSSSADSGHTSTNPGSPRSNVMPTAPQTEPGSSEISNIMPQTSNHDESNKEVQKTTAKEAKVAAAKPAEKNSRKRSFLGKDKGEPSSKKNIKCAICEDLFSHAEWDDHVANEHDLIAWKVGSRIYLDDRDLVRKLKEKLKADGKLVCSLCGMTTNRFNRFNDHVKYCIQKKMSGESEKVEKPTRKSRAPVEENVTCGVCDKTMSSDMWYGHIGRDHNYLAWQKGDTPLDLSNESAVWEHLQNIIRTKGTLTCSKCGLNRSRVKLFLAHVKTCDGTKHLLDSGISTDLNASVSDDAALGQSGQKGIVKCGVCQAEMVNSAWMDHISKKHNYLAWPQGQTPMDFGDEEVVWNHLQQFVRRYGGLTCHKCGIVRKRVKLYLSHIEECDGSENSQADISFANESLNTTTQSQSAEDWYEVPVVQEERKVIKCGVCNEEVTIVDWLHHIGKEHNHLAWKEGCKPVNLDDESAVKMHLLEISRQNNGLKCYKCEKKIKYPKVYLQHIKECNGGVNTSVSENVNVSWIEDFNKKDVKDEILTCGVCAAKVEGSEWISHIETLHQYLAWVEGQPPIDLNNQTAVQRHLYDMTKVLGGLVCNKCGLKRKYVKSFQEHIATCDGRRKLTDVSLELMSKEIIECGVCGKTMPPKEWKTHSMGEHYNIAWVVGDPPIEINNPYAVESYLKEYQFAHHKLICKVCGISRVSYVGFYAHIIVCGKSEKETEIYKSMCEICNNKYLRIYKSQHMTMHKEKELAIERRILAEKEKELKKEEELKDDVIQPGRRKAAEKAKTVIEKYKNSLHHGSHRCTKCRFSTDVEKELLDHVCVEKWDDGSDSDVSVKLEMCSEDETESETDTEVDSNVSDEEQEAREEFMIKKKKHSDSHAAKIIRLPYQVKNISVYMKRSTEEFIDRYLTDEILFPMWHNCLLEEVPESEIVNYMPPLEESCKVRFDDTHDWTTFKRFEAQSTKDLLVMFVGASIQAISWAPSNPDTEIACNQSQFLAVAIHRGPDAPRHVWDTTPVEPGLVQIWDCGNLISSTPRLALGITHDFGTVWAIDWCPSGVRDMLEDLPNTNNMPRLGLLAAACSNGTAYIFAVPYPSTVTEKEQPFYKLKPVVELRLTNGNRRVYQATAIKWSMQKGHSQVVVGYADGTTAYYDLNSDSPLLRSMENDVTIFYPFHDERAQNSSIEDVALYPGGAGCVRGAGAVCAGSVSGAGGGALQSHVAALRLLYPPHWPAALLAGDDCLVNQSINELEWWGGGRRLGGSSRAAGCQWCGRVVSAAPPLLKLLRMHPCFPDVHKQVVGKFQMIPLGNKRKRQTDDLSLVVEPLTYSESAKKYGLEFQQVTTRDRSAQQKLTSLPREAFPERFPLSDVAAMAFCPILKQHQKLAVAMHVGFIIIMNV